jgi:hypothetical protein
LKQKTILEVLHHVYQHETESKYYTDAAAYKLNENFDNYTNVEAVKEFYKYYEHDVLEHDELFSIMYEKHRDYAIALFHVFYYAKDWTTFYNTLVWAKYNVNPGCYVYALSVAVLHRPDMQGIVLPAPYEIYPYYFFNTEVVQQAQEYKMQNFNGLKQVDGKFEAIIPYNYTYDSYKQNEDQKISYFTEDIGLNSYYYYFHIDYPFWMEGKQFGLNKDRRGELYLFEHQQLLARYHLERISHGLGDIPEFSWFKKFETGYTPNLRYYNGLMFPVRSNNHQFYHEKNYYDIATVHNYERRIRDAIDYGFVILPDNTHIDLTKPESVEYLGNMIQGNPDWPFIRLYKYVVVYAKMILGGSIEYHTLEKSVPSVLEHYETAMRDPLFYVLYKRLISYYWQFKDQLPSYTQQDLEFDGVKIEKVEIEKLVTYFDYFYSDVNNLVEYDYSQHKNEYFANFLIKTRQQRLNHLPFTFKLNVQSSKTVKSVVRVFLGPKYDEFGHVIDINENRENFWFLESFVYDLKSGNNVIERNSQDFTWFVKDRTTFSQLYKHVMTAFNGGETFKLDNTEAHCGFPQRLLLPRGGVNGIPYQFYFIITPYVAPKVEQYSTYEQVYTCGIGSGSRYLDALPLGYPFDREIDETVWDTPNMHTEDVLVYHKNEQEINSKWV